MSETSRATQWPARRGRIRDLRGHPAHPWPQIAELFLRCDALAMHALVERIIASPWAGGVFGQTSHLTLLVSQTEEVDHLSRVLRIDHLPTGRIRFEYIERVAEPVRWTRECAPEDAFATFERFLQLQKWFTVAPPEAP